MKMLVSLLMFLTTSGAFAQERVEIGYGAGKTQPLAGSTFKNAASTGDGATFWLGYSLDEEWAIELGQDNLDFDGVDTKHQALVMSATYRFSQNFIHPLAKLGIASVQSKNSLDLSTNSMGAKLAAGVESSFKNISIGALLNFYHVLNTDDTSGFKNTQAVLPTVFISLHTSIDSSTADENEETSTTQAPPQESASTLATALAVEVKDSDNDGVVDTDDKCPNTSAGALVNRIGCSEKERASIRLNVNFLSGKTELTSQYDGEIQNLASFMKRFPETKVEIAGHTDSTGIEAKNEKLSQQRADSVKEALVKAGVDATRLTSIGYGSAKPLADNKAKAGREQNRRVTAEISIDVEKKK